MMKQSMQWIKVVLVNIVIFVVLVAAGELIAPVFIDIEEADRIARFIGSKPEPFMGDMNYEFVNDHFNGECLYPKIITAQGFPEFDKRNYSCSQHSIKNGLRVTSYQPSNFTNTIHFFGGSTAFGHGSVDAETIPSFLQNRINLDPNLVAFRVVNHGFSAVVVAQQLLFLMRIELSPNDIVIFYDGGNDMYQSVIYGNPEGTIIGYNAQNRFDIALIPLKFWLSHNSNIYAALSRLKRAWKGDVNPGQQRCLDEGVLKQRTAAGSDHYLSVIRKAYQHAVSTEASFFHFFQPVLVSGEQKNRTPYERGLMKKPWVQCADELNYVNSWYQKQYRGVSIKSDWMHDISDALLTRKNQEEYFLDWIHVSGAANQKIADRIYDVISQSFSLRPAS